MKTAPISQWYYIAEVKFVDANERYSAKNEQHTEQIFFLENCKRDVIKKPTENKRGGTEQLKSEYWPQEWSDHIWKIS